MRSTNLAIVDNQKLTMMKSISGDNWEVVCKGKKWKRDEKIRFKHVDTGK